MSASTVRAEAGAVTFEVEDGVATIVLDRPAKLNALTLAMYDDLAAAFDRARDDAAVGVVVLTGAGERAFCVGADLRESIPALAEGRFDISHWDGAHQKHSRLFKPVIGAVEGLCLGGGLEILLSTDLRVASGAARFGLPEVRVGVVPAGGTLTRLVRQIPRAWAMELMLGGDQIDAETALRFGILNRVVAPGTALAEARAWGRRLLECSGTAQEVVTSSVRQLADLPEDAAFHAEALHGQRAFTSADAREGLSAFAEGRQPRFPSREWAPTDAAKRDGASR